MGGLDITGFCSRTGIELERCGDAAAGDGNKDQWDFKGRITRFLPPAGHPINGGSLNDMASTSKSAKFCIGL
jgi:hypothetical protein